MLQSLEKNENWIEEEAWLKFNFYNVTFLASWFTLIFSKLKIVSCCVKRKQLAQFRC